MKDRVRLVLVGDRMLGVDRVWLLMLRKGRRGERAFNMSVVTHLAGDAGWR